MRLLSAAALALLLSAAALAAPESAGVELVWSAPPGCPREAAVRAEVERLVGRARSAGGEAPVRAAAVVTYDQRGWRATIAISGDDEGPRQREIEGETCAEVADATAIIVALAVDPASGASMAPSPKAPPPPSSPPPLTPEPAVQLSPLGPPASLVAVRPPGLPAPRVSTPRRFSVGLKAVGGLDLRSFPTTSVGFGVGGFLNFSRNRLELVAAGWLPEAVNMPRKLYAGADISLFVGSARYCRTIVEGTLGFAGCGGMELGALTATSFGVSSSGSGAAFWLAPELGVVGLLSSSQNFTLTLEITGLTPSVRRSFWITGLGEVYRPPELTVRTVIGAEVTFR